MKFIELDCVNSTHMYLKDHIKTFGYNGPVCVVTNNQTDGIGSRDNKWIGQKGNLFFSFVLDEKLLPKDLPTQSASIYFSYLLKEVMNHSGSKVWLKWPNDFYINNNKIGGTITNYSTNIFYCGIGLNLIKDDSFSSLDIQFDYRIKLKVFFDLINERISWKHIFSKYLIEFDKSKQFMTTVNNHKISLEYATLQSDGSIDIDNKKVFSLR